MKKTLGAVLIVLAAIIAVGTFGAQYINDTAEAVVAENTPGPIAFSDGTVLADEDGQRMVIYTLPQAGLSGSALTAGKYQTEVIWLNDIIDFIDAETTPQNSDEQIRVMSTVIGDEDLVEIVGVLEEHSNRYRFALRSKQKLGSTTLTMTVRGWTCDTDPDEAD